MIRTRDTETWNVAGQAARLRRGDVEVPHRAAPKGPQITVRPVGPARNEAKPLVRLALSPRAFCR